MKIGIEVEGRLHGEKTLFIGANELFQVNIELMQKHCVTQLYVSDNEGILDLELYVLMHFASYVIVTVELTKLPARVPDYINIMYNIESADFWRLRNGDQIKFSKDLNVYAVTKDQMFITYPEEFEGDITL
jgi:hypothetical protein